MAKGASQSGTLDMAIRDAAAKIAGLPLHRFLADRLGGKAALPTVEAMSPAEIAGVRARSGISQAVLAAYLNVAVGTVSQWERGERHPTGAALKLLNIVKQNGIDALR
jgi:DNA-binding transcriptional regulator YiaG